MRPWDRRRAQRPAAQSAKVFAQACKHVQTIRFRLIEVIPRHAYSKEKYDINGIKLIEDGGLHRQTGS